MSTESPASPASPASPESSRFPGAAPWANRQSLLPALDGLRAVAVLAVVTTHAAFWTGRYERGWGNNALTRLDSGVAVFLVLSGFLLIRPWLVSVAGRRRPPSLGTYAVRRVARVMPAYVVAIALCFLLLPDNADVGLPDWLRHLTFTQIYGFGWQRAGLTQTWSLATEVAFYALLPLFGALVVRSRRWRPGRLLAALGVIGLVPLPWYALTHSIEAPWTLTSGYWLPGYLGWFAGGMAMAVVRVHLDHFASTGSRWRAAEELGQRPFTCWSVALLAFFVALTPLAGPRSLEATTGPMAITKQTLYLVTAVALVWPAVFGDGRAARALLANRPMRFAGDISYGVFLYHVFVLEWVMRLLDYRVFTGAVVQVLPLTLAGSVALAAVSYRLMERPITDQVHHRPLRRRPRSRPQDPAAVPRRP